MAKTGFDKVVAVKFGLEWIPVDSVEHALTGRVAKMFGGHNYPMKGVIFMLC